ncbi:hypothetical protein [Agrobacterium sp. NPDC090283]|uniref:hypothetical protein n=1 Tax=Agrobacterium sp. NPDC090283 TaxID=3363920 RepID=UPI00383BC7FE
MSNINESFFFNQVRLNLFDGTLRAGQVVGLKAIINLWTQSFANNDDRWLAYALATAHHETDRKIAPIHEYGGDKYFHDRYDPKGSRPHVARQLGNDQEGDGVLFHGRGFVQLTGRRNYSDWAKRLNLPLLTQPDLVLQPATAAHILLEGMRLGTFTKYKLADFFSGAKADWKGARKIINGTDKADLIASYGLKYYAAISYTT